MKRNSPRTLKLRYPGADGRSTVVCCTSNTVGNHVVAALERGVRRFSVSYAGRKILPVNPDVVAGG